MGYLFNKDSAGFDKGFTPTLIMALCVFCYI